MNIKLDQHRNQLITIDLILTAFTTVLAMMTVVGAWVRSEGRLGGAATVTSPSYLSCCFDVFSKLRVTRPI